jgi:predicted nucleotidyltransferase component of viral defense system
MAFSERYRRQVALLIRTIPLVGAEASFALKGGTAINLFVREMPRLSVDIDLTYLPVRPREDSLAEIDDAMKRIADRIRTSIKGARVSLSSPQGENVITKLLVRADGVQTKIEVTPVLRGCVYDPELRSVSAAVEAAFGFAEMSVVSFADLYGGKIIAALDRQHPRDLFDVRDLLANEGVDDALRRAFIIYLLSHNRPMSEVLAPMRKNISEEFLRGFDGMTEKPISLKQLTDAREALIETVVGKMPEPHRRLLVSFERGEPEWALLGLAAAKDLPAIQWRQRNLDKLKKAERDKLVSRLEAVLFPKS